MKILHLTQVFSPLSETFIYDCIQKLEANGNDNYVFTLGLDQKTRSFEKTTLLKRKIDFFYKVKSVLYKRLKRKVDLEYMSLMAYESDLFEKVKQLKPDIIYSHFGPMGILVLRTAKKLNIPTVVSFYGYDISTLLRKRLWVKKYQKSLRHFQALIGISNYICNKIANLKGDNKNIHLIHLGVDPEKFYYNNPSTRIFDKTIICLHIGRLVPKKSPVDLLKSFQVAKDIVKDEVNLKLRIAGDGPLMDEVKKFISENKLNDCVELLGAVGEKEVFKLLGTSHIYTQHSVTGPDGDQEGQGVSLVEAASSGLPLVVTNHNGFSDVVTDGLNGFLVEEFDVRSMGEKIAYLATNINALELLGKNGRNHIIEKFNSEVEIQRLIQLFSQIALNK